MNKYEIADSIRCKILENNELTANLYTTTSVLEPMDNIFGSDLPPIEEDTEDEIMESVTRDFYVRADKIKDFIRTEMAKITNAEPLEIIDAYNEIVDALETKRPELIERIVKTPKNSGVGSYKWMLEAYILPHERFLNSDGSEIVEPW